MERFIKTSSQLFGRRVQVYAHDVVMTGLAFVLAVGLVVRPSSEEFVSQFGVAVVAVLAGGALLLLRLGLYQGMWRFASVPDLVRVVRASTVLAVALSVGALISGMQGLIPVSVIAVFWLSHIILLGGARFGYRLVKDSYFQRGQMTAVGDMPLVLVCGTDSAAANFVRFNLSSRGGRYRIIGIVAPKTNEKGRHLYGSVVLGSAGDLPTVLGELARGGKLPDRIALSPNWEKEAGQSLRDLMKAVEAFGVSVARIPDPNKLDVQGGEAGMTLRPIPVEALLGRPQTALNRQAIQSLANDRAVLVTGAGGTIGGELSRQLAALQPQKLILLDNGEFNLYRIDHEIRGAHPRLPVETILCDVRDRGAVMRVFQRLRPELVLHAAALKHVPLVEANPSEGVLTNTIGTRNVADACRASGTATMVMISTDKAIRPTNVMGATKRVAELYCQAVDVLSGSSRASATRFMAVRFGNVLGSSGSVVPLFEQQLRAGGPLTVTHPEMRRYFMTVREAVELVLQAASYGQAHSEDRGRVFVLDMGEPMRIVDLARQMIRLAGYTPDLDIEIKFTGLRPGEKLFEEILDPEEMPTKTEADGVFIASPRVMDQQLLTRVLDELETAAQSHDTARIRLILSNLVPGFARHEVDASQIVGTAAS